MVQLLSFGFVPLALLAILSYIKEYSIQFFIGGRGAEMQVLDDKTFPCLGSG